MKKIKLDENFPPSSVEIFGKYGIDTSSVFHQNMNGSTDDSVFDICTKEDRILITFDLDFANIIRYTTEGTPGIVVSRNKMKITLSNIKSLCERLAQIVVSHDIEGRLIIVEETRMRIRKPDR